MGVKLGNVLAGERTRRREVQHDTFVNGLARGIDGEAHAATAAAELHTETVTYKDGDTVLEGYLAYDTEKFGPRPGVLVVHQWTGITEHEKRKVRELAASRVE